MLLQIFARKLIPVRERGHSEDIEKELCAALKLCGPGTHENVLVILCHGWLERWPYYHFDMELCDFNLEVFARELWEPTCWEKLLSTKLCECKVELDVRIKQIWGIMQDIANGVSFIHSQKMIHRDLKPRNSISKD